MAGGQLDVLALHTVVKGSGISFKENSASWIFDCPRCSKKAKLYIRKRDGRFVCWYCATVSGFKGKPEYALAELLGVRVGEMQEKLYGGLYDESAAPTLGLEWVDFFGERDEVPFDLIPLTEMPFSLDFVPIDHRHAARGLAYLEKRGISLEVAMAHNLHYHPQVRRVIFPIIVDQTVVGWQARTIEASEWYDEETQTTKRIPKILTPKGVDRERCLMFQDHLVGSEHAVLCEGPVDAIKFHMVGGAVAAMGKSVSRGQIEVIRNSGVKKLYLALDPDAAAEITRLCRELADLQVYIVSVPDGYDDFGDMPAESVVAAFKAAVPVNGSTVFLAPATDFFTVRRQ